MIRIMLTFVVLFAVFFVGLKSVSKFTKKETWALTKLVGYSTLCATLTLGVLSLIVILF